MKSALLFLLVVSTHSGVGQTFSLTDTTFKVGAIYRPKIYFHYDSKKISTHSYPLLDSIATFLIQHKQLIVELGSHVDSVTLAENIYGRVLQTSQAYSVYTQLIGRGVDSGRLYWKNYHYSQPLIRENEWKKLKNERDRYSARNKNNRFEFKVIRINPE